jgi:hypothetical protein
VRREADGPHFDSENLFETAESYIGLAANEHRGDLTIEYVDMQDAACTHTL